jgi:hypothetical protein
VLRVDLWHTDDGWRASTVTQDGRRFSAVAADFASLSLARQLAAANVRDDGLAIYGGGFRRGRLVVTTASFRRLAASPAGKVAELFELPPRRERLTG